MAARVGEGRRGARGLVEDGGTVREPVPPRAPAVESPDRPPDFGGAIPPLGTKCRECHVEHERCICGAAVAVVWLLSWEPHSLELHECRP